MGTAGSCCVSCPSLQAFQSCRVAPLAPALTANAVLWLLSLDRGEENVLQEPSGCFWVKNLVVCPGSRLRPGHNGPLLQTNGRKAEGAEVRPPPLWVHEGEAAAWRVPRVSAGPRSPRTEMCLVFSGLPLLPA